MNPQIIVEFLAKTDKLSKGVQDVSKSGNKAGALAKKALLPAVAALGLVAAGSAKAVEAASNLNEATSATTVTFGKQAAGMISWAKTADKSLGLSTRAALEAANGFGNMLTTAGLAAPQVASMSKALVTLGGDMASFFNQDPSEMLDKLRSGLSGEAEPLRRFGVNISDAAVQSQALAMHLTKPVKNMAKIREEQTKVTLATHAYAKAVKEHGVKSDQAASASLRVDSAERALAKSLKGTTKPLTDAQKVQARYALIMDQTGKAQGDFKRTATGVANSQRTAAAQAENLSAQFGKALLPATQLIYQWLGKLMGYLAKNPGLMKAVVAGVVALAAAIVVLNLAMAVAAFLATSWALPFLGVIAAIAALIAIGILLWKNWDTVTAKLSAAWASIKATASGAVTAVVGAFQRLWAYVSGIVTRLVAWIRSNWQTIVLILGGPVAAAALLIARYWSQIVGGAQRAWAAVKSAVSTFTSWIGSQVSRIGGYLSQIAAKFDAPADAAKAAKDAIKKAIDAIPGLLSGVISKVRTEAGKIADAIKSPINAVLRAFNGIRFTIPGFSVGGQKIGPVSVPKVSVPSHTIGGFHVPELAQGGVLTSPTLFLGGEAGTEIVAPEAMLRDIVAEHGGSYTLVLQPRTADAGDVAYAFRRLELLRTGR